MDESEEQFRMPSMRHLVWSLWRLPWLCIVQVAYLIPRRFVAWIAESTTGHGVKYT